MLDTPHDDKAHSTMILGESRAGGSPATRVSGSGPSNSWGPSGRMTSSLSLQRLPSLSGRQACRLNRIFPPAASVAGCTSSCT